MDFRRRKEFNIKTWMLTNYLEGKEEQVLGWVSRNNSQKNRELTNSCQYLWGHNWIYEFKNPLQEPWSRRLKAKMKTRCCCHHDNWLSAYKAGDWTPKGYFICIADLHDSLASQNGQNVAGKCWFQLMDPILPPELWPQGSTESGLFDLSTSQTRGRIKWRL